MEMQKNFKSEESIFSCIFLLLGKGGFYIIFETYRIIFKLVQVRIKYQFIN